MPENLQPYVWFITADGAEGSAVLVGVRINNAPPVLRLLTAQHVLRENASPTGAYATDIRAWAPDDGYNPGTAIKVNVDTVLTPPENLPMVGSEDFAFLILPRGFTGKGVPLITDADCAPVLNGISICGYPGGDAIITIQRGRVRAAYFDDWKYNTLIEATASALLHPGEGAPKGGVSGGGVFHQGRYAGVYRGAYTDPGLHLFLPITGIRSWCSGRNCELVDLSVSAQVSAVQQALEQTSVIKQQNPALMSGLLDAARPNLATLRAALTDFSAYKQLHDQLHLIQILFSGAAIAVRVLPLTGERINSFATAMQAMEQQLGPTEKIIQEYNGTKATLKAFETLWFKTLKGAILDGLKTGISGPQAVTVCNKVRSVLRKHLIRINGELTANASIMDLAGLGTLFDSISKLPGLDAGLVVGYQQNAATCQLLSQLVQLQNQLHTSWQEIDTALWDAEEWLADGSDRGAFDVQWDFILTSTNDLIKAAPFTGDVGWTADMPQWLDAVNAAMTNNDTPSLITAFDRATSEIRRQFYAVDQKLRELAERIAKLRDGLDSV